MRLNINMPNIFDTIEQESSHSHPSKKRNIFDVIESQENAGIGDTAMGTVEGLGRGAVQFGKGVVGAIPAVAAFDIAAGTNTPKYLNEKGKEKYKNQPFFKPF